MCVGVRAGRVVRRAFVRAGSRRPPGARRVGGPSRLGRAGRARRPTRGPDRGPRRRGAPDGHRARDDRARHGAGPVPRREGLGRTGWRSRQGRHRPRAALERPATGVPGRPGSDRGRAPRSGRRPVRPDAGPQPGSRHHPRARGPAQGRGVSARRRPAPRAGVRRRERRRDDHRHRLRPQGPGAVRLVPARCRRSHRRTAPAASRQGRRRLSPPRPADAARRRPGRVARAQVPRGEGRCAPPGGVRDRRGGGPDDQRRPRPARVRGVHRGSPAPEATAGTRPGGS